MKTITKTPLAKRCLIISLLVFSFQYAQGQIEWRVKMVGPGKYEVDIKPAVIVEEVKCTITLSDASGQRVVNEKVNFTNQQYYTLKPGVIYSKTFTCNPIYATAIGKSITGKQWTMSNAGDKADGVAEKKTLTFNTRSGHNLMSGKKTRINTTENVPLTIPRPHKPYIIRQHETRKVISISGQVNDSQARIEQMPYGNTSAQLWIFEALRGADRGYFLIHPYNNRAMCLENRSGTRPNSPALGQFPCSGKETQKWKLNPKGGSYYIIESKSSGKVLTSYGIMAEERVPIGLFQNTHRYNQQWSIIERK